MKRVGAAPLAAASVASAVASGDASSVASAVASGDASSVASAVAVGAGATSSESFDCPERTIAARIAIPYRTATSTPFELP